MKICFVLGSGISLPAKLPSVAEITERVTSGDGFSPTGNSDSPFRLLPEGQEIVRQIELEFILWFVRWLKIQAGIRYADWPGRIVNYEDLAYLAGQIEEDHIDNYESPVGLPR